MSQQHFTGSGLSSSLNLQGGFPHSCSQIPIQPNTHTGSQLSFHILHASSLVQRNLPPPHFLPPVLILSCAHTRSSVTLVSTQLLYDTVPGAVCSSFCTQPPGSAASCALVVQHSCSPIFVSPLIYVRLICTMRTSPSGTQALNKISLLPVITLSHTLILMMLKNVNYLSRRYLSPAEFISLFTKSPLVHVHQTG